MERSVVWSGTATRTESGRSRADGNLLCIITVRDRKDIKKVRFN